MSMPLNLTSPALARSRLTVLLAVLLAFMGAVLATNFPSSEEPTIQIRMATVSVLAPGLSADRMESLIAQPIEVRAREIADVKRLETTVRPGFAIIYVTLKDSVAPDQLPIVWQKLRAKMGEVQPALPQGALGPFVDDEFGRTAVLVLAVTGEGYTPAELHAYARDVRDGLSLVPGAERASLHGVQEDRVYLDLDLERLRASGLSPAQVTAQLAAQNIVASAGETVVNGQSAPIEVSGEITRTQGFAGVTVALPSGGAVRLGDIARIVRAPVDRPDTAAFWNGRQAVVVAVSMVTGESIGAFSERLRSRAEALRQTLPAGVELEVISDQAKIVEKDISKVGIVFAETVVIVMAVVVVFLGIRSGLIVGTIVPLTMLASLVFMQLMEIELHSISIAALIISLGLLVDNGIVIVEDVERRLAEGEERVHAAVEAGRTLAIPLLVSCLTVILAFMPLVLVQSSTGEYMRSLGLVSAITLLLSWIFALTVIPLLCIRFAKAHAGAHAADEGAAYNTRFYRGYRRLLETALRHRAIYTGAMLALLALAVVQMGRIPSSLLPPSNRPAIQIPVELLPGASSRATFETARKLSEYLSDRQQNPEVESNATYVGDGGPRFILGLNPPLPAANRAYIVVNLVKGSDPEDVIERMKRDLALQFPELRFDPKRFSLGSGDAGAAIFRLTGPDLAVLEAKAATLGAELQKLPDPPSVRLESEGAVPRLAVDVDQAAARRAGLSSEDVAAALRRATDGDIVSVLREGDVQVPVVLRSADPARLSPETLGAIQVVSQDGLRSAPLAQIASLRLASQAALIQRRDGERYVQVIARRPGATAQELANEAQPAIDALALPVGYRIELGGEIEDSAEVAIALGGFLPLCMAGMIALFVWQFNSARKTFIILASIPFCLIGVTAGLTLAGASLSFTGILGILALAGIIVNNAILLIERIDAEQVAGHSGREAILLASVKRLRPIVMTKLVCVLGLVPLLLTGGALWYPLAAGMIGGLLLGTLVTLGLVPILYSWLFRESALNTSASHPAGLVEANP